MKNKKVTASSISNSIIGTYEGEVLNPNITNKNGLDITMDVMTTVLESEDYKQGIEYGWFIGFLGHPEDPNCMEFQNGCIVMTDMWIENGKIYGKFNLVDTPVGQIVKKFIDAGVKFGISIRGAGDIIDNSVDPETFVFRGYDLVSFPAYPDSIPKFTAIAASSNLDDQKKYQAVCAAVKANIESINSCAAIDVLQAQFAPQSNEYKALAKRREKILSGKTFNIDQQKIEAMTSLYLETFAEVVTLSEQVERLKLERSSAISACKRKVSAIKRITASQADDMSKSLDSVTASCTALRKRAQLLSDNCHSLREQNAQLKDSLDDAQKTNLIYRQRVEAGTDEIQKREQTISGLQRKLRETVTAGSKLESRSSDLGDENRKLKSEIRSCKEMLRAYQEAYSSIYASALGVNPNSISFTDSTSVAELQKRIAGATNTVNLPSTVTVEPLFYDCDEADDEIITL